MRRVYYVYPMKHTVSFTVIARRHISCLRRHGFEVVEVDEFEVPRRFDAPVILHPGFFIYGRNLDLKAPKVILVDVVETNALTHTALKLAEMADLLIVPSNYSRCVLRRLGLANVEVVPHWIPYEYMYRERREPRHPIIKWLKECKEKEGWLAILYQLWHSGLRKGALEAYEILALLRSFHRRGWKPVLKRADIKDPLLGPFYTLDTFEIAEWLSDEDMIDLYDVVDLHLCTARAGGFEVTALESIARGTPTAAPVCGCYSEYMEFITIPLGCKFGEWPLGVEGWYAHAGLGWRVDPVDATMKLLRFIEDEGYREYIRERAAGLRELAWRRLGEPRICELFANVIRGVVSA